MKTAIEPMARNSDCQFWRLRSQKSAFAQYSPHVIVGSLCFELLVVVRTPAVDGLAEPAAEEAKRHRKQERVSVEEAG